MVITNCWKAGDLMRVLQSATLPMSTDMNVDNLYYTGADPAGCAPPKIGENMIFWHKIVIFSHEIPQNFSRLPPQLEFFFHFFCVK